MTKIVITEEQKQEIIKRYQNGESINSIANSGILNASWSVLRDRLIEWGIHKPKVSLDDEFDEILELWLEGTSLCKLEKQFHHNKATISKKLKELGYNVKNPQLVCQINENVFDIIDTEEKAYWLGFMYADGNIRTITDPTKKTQYTVTLSLKLSDKEHLYKFNNFMEHKKDNVKLRPNDIHPNCTWYIVNYHLWNTLNDKGCIPQKSLILKFPEESIFSNKSLIRHFIRGYFDGDGTFSYDKRLKYIIPRLSLLGTKDMCEGIIKNVNSDNYNLYLKDENHINTWTLKYGVEGSVKFMHYLYDNCSIYLDRKYERYKCFCDKSEQPFEVLNLPAFTEYGKNQ